MVVLDAGSPVSTIPAKRIQGFVASVGTRLWRTSKMRFPGAGPRGRPTPLDSD